MKKISIIALTIIISSCMLTNTVIAQEKTLNQLESEAKANRAAYNKAKNQKALSEQERAEAQKQKAEVESEIKSINNELNTIQNDITNLQKDIDIKDKEIKELMKFVQVSNGESAYLEYAFGASSFTDFIYRISVAEQLSNYNEDLINGYNEDIKRLEQKQKELTTKQAELSKKEQELSVLEAKLTKEIETLGEGMLSKDDEYKTQISLINNLKSLGCKGNETMSSCQRRIAASMSSSGSISGSSSSHTGTGNGVTYYMPLMQGYISSPYGQRSGEFHTGTDFSNHAVSNVYPVAPGKVVAYVDGSTSTCGNHIIYIYHPSSNYTTSYWHLTNRKVSLGQEVTPSTLLGQTGGPSYTDGQYYGNTYVQCAFGGHVHLNLFNGLSVSNSGRINPGNFVKNMPATNVRFTSPR